MKKKLVFAAGICFILFFLFHYIYHPTQEHWKHMTTITQTDFPEHTDSVPHVEPIKEWVSNIFETSIPRAFATNDIDNAINVFHCNEKGLKKEEISRNFLENVSGGDISPMPVFSNEWIGYGQTRGFERFNLRTSEFKDQIVCEGFEETILACRALVPEKKVFAFLIKYSGDNERYNIIKVFDLSEEQPRLISKVNIGSVSRFAFFVLDTLIFYYDIKSIKVVALDKNLKPVRHDFSDAFYANKEKLVGSPDITVNPVFPIAVVYSEFIGVLSWKDRKHDLWPFIGMRDNMSISYFNFSHDGKWLGWLTVEEKNNPEEFASFWIAKVNMSIPGCLEKPQLIGKSFVSYSAIRCTAWAENPNTFIVSAQNAIYWWHIK